MFEVLITTNSIYTFFTIFHFYAVENVSEQDLFAVAVCIQPEVQFHTGHLQAKLKMCDNHPRHRETE